LPTFHRYNTPRLVTGVCRWLTAPCLPVVRTVDCPFDAAVNSRSCAVAVVLIAGVADAVRLYRFTGCCDYYDVLDTRRSRVLLQAGLTFWDLPWPDLTYRVYPMMSVESVFWRWTCDCIRSVIPLFFFWFDCSRWSTIVPGMELPHPAVLTWPCSTFAANAAVPHDGLPYVIPRYLCGLCRLPVITCLLNLNALTAAVFEHYRLTALPCGGTFPSGDFAVRLTFIADVLGACGCCVVECRAWYYATCHLTLQMRTPWCRCRGYLLPRVYSLLIYAFYDSHGGDAILPFMLIIFPLPLLFWGRIPFCDYPCSRLLFCHYDGAERTTCWVTIPFILPPRLPHTTNLLYNSFICRYIDYGFLGTFHTIRLFMGCRTFVYLLYLPLLHAFYPYLPCHAGDGHSCSVMHLTGALWVFVVGDR